MRRNLSRKYLLLRETIESNEQKLRELRQKADEISSKIEKMSAQTEKDRKGLAAVVDLLLFENPDWTPEGARAEMPWTSIRKPKDMNLRPDLMKVLKAARSPLEVKEIATRVLRLRNESVEPTDHFLDDALPASLSTILRRGKDTIFIEHDAKPRQWSLRR